MKKDKSTKSGVLYVDDESENLTVFKFAFRKFYNVYLAESAKEGMEILHNNDIELLLQINVCLK